MVCKKPFLRRGPCPTELMRPPSGSLKKNLSEWEDLELGAKKGLTKRQKVELMSKPRSSGRKEERREKLGGTNGQGHRALEGGLMGPWLSAAQWFRGRLACWADLGWFPSSGADGWRTSNKSLPRALFCSLSCKRHHRIYFSGLLWGLKRYTWEWEKIIATHKKYPELKVEEKTTNQ